MRRLGLPLVLLCCLVLAGCAAGPKQLTRSVDDWDNKLYVQSPWMSNILHIVPFFPLMNLVAGWGDVLIVNPVAFWADDAWDGKGTAFKHLDVTATDGSFNSLLLDDTGFMAKK